MAVPPLLSRSTSLLRSDLLRSQLQATQRRLDEAQRQISTGKAVDAPSDAPDKVGNILHLQRSLAEREQRAENLQHAAGVLDLADSSLGEAADLLREAVTIASSQIGVGSDTETRATEAHVIDAHVKGLIDLVNKQQRELSIFGGRNGAEPGGQVLESFLGGVRYTGAAANLLGDLGSLSDSAVNANAADAFGALSSRVRSGVDLGVTASGDTHVTDLAGATHEGIRPGSVALSVNGTTTSVDLSTIDTLDDVATRINAAIADLGGNGGLAVNGAGFELTKTGGGTISIGELAAGKTAGDLGITLTASSGTVAGPAVGARLTPTTPLADLGTAIDFASGLLIQQGETTKVADFSAATTVQDLLNTVEQVGLGLRMQINDAGTGLDLISEVSGVALSIGENGGTTAADLGLATLGPDTALADLRGGRGVEPLLGEEDLEFVLHDGTTFGVNLDAATRVSDVVTAVTNAAAAAAGLTVGTDFDFSLALSGTGFVVSDNTAGTENFVIRNAGPSHAADHLGLTNDAGAATTFTTDDPGAVRVENALTHLMDLAKSLREDSTTGITLAGGRLEDDTDEVITARARVGTQAKRVQDGITRNEDETITEQSMLSQLQDADLTEVITRFGQLQTQLQAAMTAGTQANRLSLLDFLG